MRLYVGNIPFTITPDEVRQHFSAVGVVSDVRLLTDRETGRARGFGFVDMDDAGAARAIAELDQTDLGGRRIIVNEAHEKQRGGGSGGQRRDRGQDY